MTRCVEIELEYGNKYSAFMNQKPYYEGECAHNFAFKLKKYLTRIRIITLI